MEKTMTNTQETLEQKAKRMYDEYIKTNGYKPSEAEVEIEDYDGSTANLTVSITGDESNENSFESLEEMLENEKYGYEITVIKGFKGKAEEKEEEEEEEETDEENEEEDGTEEKKEKTDEGNEQGKGMTMEEKRKTYDPFKQAICDYLRKRAQQEPEFKEKLKNPKKDIEKCLNYIIGSVKETGRRGFADEEIYSMAVHYYDEPDESLKKYGKTKCQVVINKEVELTEEEKKEIIKEERKKKEEEVRREARDEMKREMKKELEGKIELTEEEKAKARESAMERKVNEIKAKLRSDMIGSIELTEEEKEEARRIALSRKADDEKRRIEAENYRKEAKRKEEAKKKAEQEKKNGQMTLNLFE